MSNLILKLTLSSFDLKQLELISKKMSEAMACKKIVGPIFLPVKFQKFCILRSPFKHKDSREEFEMRFHKVVFFINLNDKIRAIKFFKILFHFISFHFSKDILYNIKYI